MTRNSPELPKNVGSPSKAKYLAQSPKSPKTSSPINASKKQPITPVKMPSFDFAYKNTTYNSFFTGETSKRTRITHDAAMPRLKVIKRNYFGNQIVTTSKSNFVSKPEFFEKSSPVASLEKLRRKSNKISASEEADLRKRLYSPSKKIIPYVPKLPVSPTHRVMGTAYRNAFDYKQFTKKNFPDRVHATYNMLPSVGVKFHGNTTKNSAYTWKMCARSPDFRPYTGIGQALPLSARTSYKENHPPHAKFKRTQSYSPKRKYIMVPDNRMFGTTYQHSWH